MTRCSLNRLLGLLLIGWSAALALDAQACDVPVFRYALERWPAAGYEVVVLHRGGLTASQRTLAERLGGTGAEAMARANLRLRLADLGGERDARLKQLWDETGKPQLPYMVLLYPPETQIARPAWSGRLTAGNVGRLADSPARREIARRILDGHSAVWALLEGGDPSKDAAAKSLLETRLKQAEQTLELPPAADGAWAQETRPPGIVGPPLQVRFSLVSLSRTDPAESVFVEMLLQSEAGLTEYASQPMAFPIFGRGRALYALVGRGITGENVLEACQFLIGPCACQAKETNPGTDVLMAVDWDAKLAGSETQTVESQPLVSLATLAEAAEAERPAPPSPETPPPAPKPSVSESKAALPAPQGSAPTSQARAKAPRPSAPTPKASEPTPQAHAAAHSDAGPAPAQPSSGLLRNLLIALGLIALVTALLVVRIARQAPRDRP